jgi:demethylmenaquinone methyltransferase/2-methoxy-6-polyprenyl-1,4-benzoquinol methylase
MQPDETALKQYYAARAREYERVYAKPERQADLTRLKELLPSMVAGRRVLEVACGTGYWTQFMAETAKSIVALDVNPETLAVATEKSWPAGRVRFGTADAYALPAELGLFDAAFAGFWWSHVLLRDRPRFLRALDARLAPGAKVVFLDNLLVANSSTAISHRDDEGNTYQRRRLEDGSEHVVLKNFPTAKELVADVALYGCNTKHLTLEYYWLFSYEKPAAA